MSDLIQHLVPAYYSAEEKNLKLVFFDLLFRPLLDIIHQANPQVEAVKPSELANMAPLEPLREALHTGQVQYDDADGIFSGDFSSSISRPLEEMGAQFDPRRKVYRIPRERVPAWVRAESGFYAVTAKETHQLLQRSLNEIQRDLERRVEGLAFRPAATAKAVKHGFRRVANEIGISPDLAESSLDKIKRTYTDNLKLKIKGFSSEMIDSLRATVENNATNGYRFDKLIAGLRTKYGVSASKARFLAQNETSIFMATFRENRFAEVGITSYRWSTSLDERVRHPAPGHLGPDHRRLQGMVFTYANPPIVDTKTGRRANPGKDYNCRCNDDPQLPKVLKEAA